MLAKVEIKIHSSVTLKDDPLPEITDETNLGYVKYTDKGEVLLLSYKSVTEGGAVTTEVYPVEGGIRLVRRGAIDSELVFCEGESHSSLYKLPPYTFDMTVKTKKLGISLTPFGGEIRISYLACIGGAEKTCEMRITAKRI